MPYGWVSFQTTFSYLEWLSKIFNDMKHRARSVCNSWASCYNPRCERPPYWNSCWPQLSNRFQPNSAKVTWRNFKLHIWKIPDGELPLFWKIVISQYLSETSSDLDKIWYTEVDSDSMCVIVFIFRILPDGRFYRHQLSLHVLRLDISFKFYISVISVDHSNREFYNEIFLFAASLVILFSRMPFMSVSPCITWPVYLAWDWL